MTRTRSEYRLTSLGSLPPAPTLELRAPVDQDRAALAALLLDAYRGTIDDEGEDREDALAAIDHYLAIIHRDQSIVLDGDESLVAMCFVLTVGGVRYIDPVAVAPAAKRSGLGRDLVLSALHGLASGGVAEVGAVITDGNTPSERLFAGLGFARVGPWPT